MLMGKVGDRNYELPPRMFTRTRSGTEYFFCYIGKGKSREEVSLGVHFAFLLGIVATFFPRAAV